jgi:hypothetical protein
MSKFATTYNQPLWIKLKPACKHISIGKDRLIRLVKDRIIKGYQDPESGNNDWLINRVSLEEYRESQYQSAQYEIESKVLEVMSRM